MPATCRLAIERQPFLIGKARRRPDRAHRPRQSARGSRNGIALFREEGGNTDYLDPWPRVLLALNDGLERVPAFVEALLALELLESFVLDVELDDGSANRLTGFYAINEERLRALDASGAG